MVNLNHYQTGHGIAGPETYIKGVSVGLFSVFYFDMSFIVLRGL
jgi:hypothetical protein